MTRMMSGHPSDPEQTRADPSAAPTRASSILSLLSALPLAMALLSNGPTPAFAAGVVGSGTLQSCTEAALDAALAGGGVVTFDCGLAPATITITSTKSISQPTTIEGGGRVTISGGDRVGVFSVEAEAAFTVQNLTITLGASLSGGGIANLSGTVTVVNSSFLDNQATTGGGITNPSGGTVTVTDSTFSGNEADSGGGIYSEGVLAIAKSTFSENGGVEPFTITYGGGVAVGGGMTTIVNSTFSNNSAVGRIPGCRFPGCPGSGGGAFVSAGLLTISNSTFSGNSTDGNGGAIANGGGTLTVTNSTFSGNYAERGAAAIDNAAACGEAQDTPCPATLTNTIVANSRQGGNCAGILTDGGHNLDSDGTCGVGPASDPLLDPAGLADNGGPTRTIALLRGSPAIDAGDAVTCAAAPVNGLDERGYVRPGVGYAQCSIGAYEYNSLGPPAGCAGNCDSRGSVTVDELVTLINIALDRVNAGTCAAGDMNDDGTITIEEILAAVKAALAGCIDIEEATVADLQAAMDGGGIGGLDLVDRYLRRIETIDRNGPELRAVVEINPEARSIAADLDAERGAQGARGPLHGIPVLLKDNIDTFDLMLTTAGSLALLDAPASLDATVARRLRDAGAVLLGKTNLSEWANMRSFRATSGWSARGGQTLNPYALDRSPCGSSSGSAVAVAANLCAVALGTETDGSVVCPAAVNSIVGLKPTVGLTSRAGVIPLAHSQDTVGVLARTVADAATVLGVLAGPDPRDPATQASEGHVSADYTQFLDPGGLRDARIGVPRQVVYGGSPVNDAALDAAIEAMRAAGAVIVDPADVPSAAEIADDPSNFRVLLYEFKADLNAYLATRNGLAVATLTDLILFNYAHADTELALFGQEIFILANPLGSLETPEYLAALATTQRLARDEGLDAVMNEYGIDALVASTAPPPWPIDYSTGDPPWPFLPLSSVAARAGYPVITVPAGFADDLPVGICFVGRAFGEPTLIRLAYAFEQATHARRTPPASTR
jgi:amidase